MAADSCTIGPNIKVNGRMTGTGDVSVEGAVEGEISLDDNLSVADGGRVVADVEAQTVTVEGHLEGDVVAREIVNLIAGSTVTGNIRAPRINIEEGARFKGNIDMDVDIPEAG
ncbi:MAG: bactofilin family protein [Myxococcota bacterium]